MVILTAVSCEEMLEVSPKTSLAADDALSTYLGVNAALNGAYAGFRGGTDGDYYGLEMVYAPDLLSDNMVLAQDGSGRGVGYNTNSSGYHIDIWPEVYQIINRTNLVLEAADELTDASEEEIASLKAQAYFLRGVLYFDLVKSYAYNPNHIVDGFDLGVPIIEQAVNDFTRVTYPSRSSVTEVYSYIESSFQSALTEFGNVSNPNSGAPFYATEGATHAMLSRLYLYWAGDHYDEAISESDAALASGVGEFQGTESYVSMWAESSNPESVFEIAFNYLSEAMVTPDNNSIQAYYQQYVNSNGTLVGWGDLVVSSEFMSLFEEGDVRSEVIFPYTRAVGQVVQQTNKFQGSNGTFGWDNTPVMRISEIYLNRAEAYAMSNQEGAAQADLNKIRTRAGLDPIYPSGDDLLEAILRERRIELAFEGQRWFDLKRLGRDISKPEGADVSYSDYRILPPIPTSDLQINDNLVPNPGY